MVFGNGKIKQHRNEIVGNGITVTENSITKIMFSHLQQLVDTECRISHYTIRYPPTTMRSDAAMKNQNIKRRAAAQQKSSHKWNENRRRKKIVNDCDGCEKKMPGMEISRKMDVVQSQQQTSVLCECIFQLCSSSHFVAFIHFSFYSIFCLRQIISTQRQR